MTTTGYSSAGPAQIAAGHTADQELRGGIAFDVVPAALPRGCTSSESDHSGPIRNGASAGYVPQIAYTYMGHAS